jgi:hypothetical protein
VLSDHTDEDGALLFVHACRMGLEGIVSKRLSAPYRAVAGLVEGEEPGQPGDGSGPGSRVVKAGLGGCGMTPVRGGFLRKTMEVKTATRRLFNNLYNKSLSASRQGWELFLAARLRSQIVPWQIRARDAVKKAIETAFGPR